MKALICGKWEIPLNFKVSSESHRQVYERSYVHYVSDNLPLVSAKCWATEWLFKDLNLSGLDIVEYFGGVGIQATILRNLCNPGRHVVLDNGINCTEHLLSLGYESERLPFEESLKKFTDFEVKVADFPSSSVISVETRWKGFYSLFKAPSKLVVWTDTSVSRPIQLHGSKYSKKLDGTELKTKEEYIRKYSEKLYKEYGFSICKAAFRGRTAVYLAAVPSPSETEFKSFREKDYENGFKIETVN